MNFTNKNDLPAPLAKFLSRDSYSKGGADFSATGLLRPARESALMSRHWQDIEVDVSSRVWTAFGTACHSIMEESYSDEETMSEVRLFAEIDGVGISGKADLIRRVNDSHVICDAKFTSTFKAQRYLEGDPDALSDYQKQLNVYAYLAHRNFIPVEQLELWLFLKDWSMAKLDRSGPLYPRAPIMVVKFTPWEIEDIEEFMRERIEAHVQAREFALPECTEEERWAKPSKWAAVKTGNKRASKVFDDQDSAEAYVETTLRGKGHVEHRPGDSMKCRLYCDAAPFCAQWKAINDSGESTPTSKEAA